MRDVEGNKKNPEQPIESPDIQDESNDDRGTDPNGCRRRRIGLGVLALVLVAGIVWISVHFGTRSSNVKVLETSAEESLPSLIKVAPIGTGGISIEYTELFVDSSKLFYYVNVQGLDFAIMEGVTDPENVAMYLTESEAPTIEDLVGRRRLATNGSGETLRIGLVNSLEFPYKLPATFLPGDFNGALFTEEDSQGDAIVEISSASFNVIVAPERNIASSPALPIVPTSSPTKEPVMAPALTGPDLPPVLTSSISGRYGIGGSITIDYVQTFENGDVLDVPRLRFDIPSLADAPGPYLYLSKRPFAETRRGSLKSDDIFIPMDEVPGGEFSVMGQFDQFLDEIDDVQDLKDYLNGSWIVWCRPFSVWIGGGSISVA